MQIKAPVVTVKLVLLCLLMPFFAAAKNGVQQLLTKQQYEQLFPHHHRMYTYEALLSAADAFPAFCGEGTVAVRKQELAAFLAHAFQETGGGWAGAPGGRLLYGLMFTEEQACKDGHCTQYNTGGTSAYKPVEGKSYHGRGPLQITYAYNYGLAGDELQLPLLQQPELAATNGTVAFKTALWFWMRAQKPKPSCHEVMTGKWMPDEKDKAANRTPGFGMTINIINGGIECNATDKEVIANRENRVNFYRFCAKKLGVQPGPDCDCNGMKPYGN
ncbi:chitinase [Deminuibacter soli]|uniref:Glycoside hydrolase family 19 catalytic domain-containing protein n=1 Tax=Deminuibacter soli TaxID=2291815 RepID=A0A3E1NQM7_9BACT|nr:chitinase [Deminuibacter soli]RFM30207.1 hypothetical protein DXN05_04345 [Deminuibacter soli]